MSCMNRLYLHTHLLHHLYTILEGESYTLLHSTQKMCTGVSIEVKAMNAATWSTVIKHTLGTIAKR